MELWPSADLVPAPSNCDPMASFSQHPVRKTMAPQTNVATSHPPHHQRPRPTHSQRRLTIEIPMDRCLRAAGSFIHDLRTPSVPETLHGGPDHPLLISAVENPAFVSRWTAFQASRPHAAFTSTQYRSWWRTQSMVK